MHRAISLCLAGLAASACQGGALAGEDDGDGHGSAGEDEPLEIIGAWVDHESGAEHDIDQMRWVQRFGAVVYTFDIELYDADDRWVVANSVNTMKWYRFDWTFEGLPLYYCSTAPGVDSQAVAVAATDPDPSDPTAGGCMGGPWKRLDPR